MPSDHVFDVTAANFTTDVVERSAEVPVLLDFWAEWCGPCKTLTPVLEQLATEYGGGFLLGKVDTEANRELAAAFQVQSIPFVVLFAGGRPVDAFAQALPVDEVREFLARGGVQPQEAVDEEQAAAATLDQALLAAKRHALAGDLAAAEAALASIDEEADQAAEAGRIREGLAWLGADLAAPDEPAAALLRARAALQQGAVEQAMEEVLASLAADRSYGDGIARRAMLLLFSLAGEDSDLAAGYRRRMATLLY